MIRTWEIWNKEWLEFCHNVEFRWNIDWLLFRYEWTKLYVKSKKYYEIE